MVGLLTFAAATTEVEGRCLAQILKLKKQPPPDSPVPMQPSEPKPVPEFKHPLLHPFQPHPVAGKDGKDGRDGQQGPAGKDAPPVDLGPILDALARLEKRIDSLPVGKDGKDGTPGKEGAPGKDAPAPDLTALAAAIARLELRIDGMKPGAPIIVEGKQGLPGVPAPVDYAKLAEEVAKRLPAQPAFFEIVPIRK